MKTTGETAAALRDSRYLVLPIEAVARMQSGDFRVSMSEILPNGYITLGSFTNDGRYRVSELADDIRRTGVERPLGIYMGRTRPVVHDGQYRYAAATMAAAMHLPVEITYPEDVPDVPEWGCTAPGPSSAGNAHRLTRAEYPASVALESSIQASPDDSELPPAENGSDTACNDCGRETLSTRPGVPTENYMVHDHLWQRAGLGRGRLCIGCLERHLGRQLARHDFPDLPVNDPSFEPTDRYAWSYRTERLKDRWKRQASTAAPRDTPVFPVEEALDFADYVLLAARHAAGPPTGPGSAVAAGDEQGRPTGDFPKPAAPGASATPTGLRRVLGQASKQTRRRGP